MMERLLSRAALYHEQKNFTRAWEDLDESLEIAEQGDMKLHLADYHIEACRLLRAEMTCPSGDCADFETRFQGHLRTAKELVEKTGYGRRNGELAGL